MGRAGRWLKAKAPGLHRFLTRRDGKWPFLREALAAVLVVGVLVFALWGFTGQGVPFAGGYPVVVVTTGSMMHCENYPHADLGKDCVPTSWGRLGTIDPGDLVFVHRVTDPAQVDTAAAHDGTHYGRYGDVVVYRPGGDAGRTPIIHRALFWVQVNVDGTFTVPAFGLDRAGSLDVPGARTLTGDAGGCDVTPMFRPLHGDPPGMPATARSGFVTRGDNNNAADQCSGMPPARLQWVLGQARGEIPYVGLVNLLWGDITGHTSHFSDAGGDSRTMFYVIVAVVVAAPWLVEMGLRRRRGKDEDREE